LLLVPLLMATKPVTPTQKQSQMQGQEQQQSQTVTTAASASAQQSNEQSVTSNTENNSFNVVLVPNNNTEPCLRVIGIMFSGSSGGAGIGWPYRSAKCDYEAAADDAFAQGQIDIGWYWKCQNKNLHKKFGSPELCHIAMISMLERPRELPQTDPVVVTPLVVNCNNGEHDEKHDRIFKSCQSK